VNDVVRRAQAGDQAAFEDLYRDHAGRVYALCLRMTADVGRAEELAQDVFLRAWTKLSTFRGDAAFSTWLHRLAVNVVLADRRSQGKRWSRLIATDDLEVFEGAVAEIAEVTGTAVGTSKAQLHRARKLLREALER